MRKENGRNYRSTLLFVCVIVMVLAGVMVWIEQSREVSFKWTIEKEEVTGSQYASTVRKESCVICKELNGKHKGENNLGIINLHDGSYHYVRLNRYDLKGNEKQEPDTYFTIDTSASAKNKMNITVMANADRGYANVDIDLGEETEIDYEKVANNCCQTCLDYILNRAEIDIVQFGVAVVNHKDNAVKILSQNLMSFQNEDYLVSCELRRDKRTEKPVKLELLVFYCPVRM